MCFNPRPHFVSATDQFLGGWHMLAWLGRDIRIMVMMAKPAEQNCAVRSVLGTAKSTSVAQSNPPMLRE